MVLSNEVRWLVLTCLITSLFWIPYIINRMAELGLWTAIWNPYPDLGAKRDWARRMQLAHHNAIENLMIFAPLVILIEVLKLNSDTTSIACMVYFYSRLAHFMVFTLAIPILRVVLFIIGFASQLVLISHLLLVF